MEKIFDIAKDSEQKWGVIAQGIDGNFEEIEQRVGELNGALNGKEKTKLTFNFTAQYQFLEIEGTLKAGTEIQISIPQKTGGCALYDATKTKQIGVNFIDGATYTLEEDAYYIRRIGDFTTCIVTYGEETQGILQKVKTNETNISTLKEKVGTLSDDVENITANDVPCLKEYAEIDYVGKYNIENCIIRADGSAVNDADRIATDFINIKNAKWVKTKCVYGSGVYCAFYSDDKQTCIKSYSYDSGANGRTQLPIPQNAVYFRGCTNKAEQEKVLVVYDRLVSNVQDELDKLVKKTSTNVSPFVPRNGHVFGGYKEFGMASPKTILNEPTMNASARQLLFSHDIELGRYKYEMVFKCNDANSIVGIGVYLSMFGSTTEVRASGNTFTLTYGKDESGDTTSAISATDVWSGNMPFTLSVGKYYKLSIERIEMGDVADFSESEKYYPYNACVYGGHKYFFKNEHQGAWSDSDVYQLFDDFSEDGGIFSITDIENGATFGRKLLRSPYRNDIGDLRTIAPRNITILTGAPYVSLKKGNIEVINISVSSSYNPKAKILITGHSYVGGDTVVGVSFNEKAGQQCKYASLIANAIGKNDVVVVGQGGEGLRDRYIQLAKKHIEWFCPDYVVFVLGFNDMQERTADDYIERLTELCEFCETHKIKPVVECGAMSYKYDTDEKREWISKVNSWIRGGSIRFVDWAGNLTQNDKITADICNSGSIYESLPFNSDGVHPSLAGHQKIFECYQREMAELFNE